jgi:hypothetical protein
MRRDATGKPCGSSTFKGQKVQRLMPVQSSMSEVLGRRDVKTFGLNFHVLKILETSNAPNLALAFLQPGFQFPQRHRGLRSSLLNEFPKARGALQNNILPIAPLNPDQHRSRLPAPRDHHPFALRGINAFFNLFL